MSYLDMVDIEKLLTLFFSSFAVVFLLGFQSQLVKDKHAKESFVTSLMIGVVQMILYKVAPNSNHIEAASYILGGAFGIVSSIHAHNFYLFLRGNK